MYYKPNPNQETIDGFVLPFGGKSSTENRWVKLAEMIPWEKIEEKYIESINKDRG